MKQIRTSTESETFDLAGQNIVTITNVIKNAFSEPFPIKEMIRITFITGAGKLGRQKYDDGAAKAVTSTLRSLGFVDDSSASCIPQCAGTFKLQHDTGKNLKTVVVFPRILEVNEDDAISGGISGMNLKGKSSLLPEGSPEHACAILSVEAFQKLVERKCQSWSQKRACMYALSDLSDKLKEYEAKLMNGKPLTEEEQDFYDAVSLDSLEKKEAFLKQGMQTHISSENITIFEKKKLLEQVEERIQTLSREISELEKQKKRT